VHGTIHLHRAALGTLDDADIIAELTSVPGIGRDAAQMFLITQLQRLDASPTGDDELRTGYCIATHTPTRAYRLPATGSWIHGTVFQTVARQRPWEIADRHHHFVTASGHSCKELACDHWAREPPQQLTYRRSLPPTQGDCD
jgi:hypothetical protein